MWQEGGGGSGSRATRRSSRVAMTAAPPPAVPGVEAWSWCAADASPMPANALGLAGSGSTVMLGAPVSSPAAAAPSFDPMAYIPDLDDHDLDDNSDNVHSPQQHFFPSQHNSAALGSAAMFAASSASAVTAEDQLIRVKARRGSRTQSFASATEFASHGFDTGAGGGLSITVPPQLPPPNTLQAGSTPNFPGMTNYRSHAPSFADSIGDLDIGDRLALQTPHGSPRVPYLTSTSIHSSSVHALLSAGSGGGVGSGHASAAASQPGTPYSGAMPFPTPHSPGGIGYLGQRGHLQRSTSGGAGSAAFAGVPLAISGRKRSGSAFGAGFPLSANSTAPGTPTNGVGSAPTAALPPRSSPLVSGLVPSPGHRAVRSTSNGVQSPRAPAGAPSSQLSRHGSYGSMRLHAGGSMPTPSSLTASAILRAHQNPQMSIIPGLDGPGGMNLDLGPGAVPSSSSSDARQAGSGAHVAHFASYPVSTAAAAALQQQQNLDGFSRPISPADLLGIDGTSIDASSAGVNRGAVVTGRSQSLMGMLMTSNSSSMLGTSVSPRMHSLTAASSSLGASHGSAAATAMSGSVSSFAHQQQQQQQMMKDVHFDEAMREFGLDAAHHANLILSHDGELMLESGSAGHDVHPSSASGEHFLQQARQQRINASIDPDLASALSRLPSHDQSSTANGMAVMIERPASVMSVFTSSGTGTGGTSSTVSGLQSSAASVRSSSPMMSGAMNPQSTLQSSNNASLASGASHAPLLRTTSGKQMIQQPQLLHAIEEHHSEHDDLDGAVNNSSSESSPHLASTLHLPGANLGVKQGTTGTYTSPGSDNEASSSDGDGGGSCLLSVGPSTGGISRGSASQRSSFDGQSSSVFSSNVSSSTQSLASPRRSTARSIGAATVSTSVSVLSVHHASASDSTAGAAVHSLASNSSNSSPTRPHTHSQRAAVEAAVPAAEAPLTPATAETDFLPGVVMVPQHAAACGRVGRCRVGAAVITQMYSPLFAECADEALEMLLLGTDTRELQLKLTANRSAPLAPPQHQVGIPAALSSGPFCGVARMVHPGFQGGWAFMRFPLPKHVQSAPVLAAAAAPLQPVMPMVSTTNSLPQASAAPGSSSAAGAAIAATGAQPAASAFPWPQLAARTSAAPTTAQQMLQPSTPLLSSTSTAAPLLPYAAVNKTGSHLGLHWSTSAAPAPSDGQHRSVHEQLAASFGSSGNHRQVSATNPAAPVGVLDGFVAANSPVLAAISAQIPVGSLAGRLSRTSSGTVPLSTLVLGAPVSPPSPMLTSSYAAAGRQPDAATSWQQQALAPRIGSTAFVAGASSSTTSSSSPLMHIQAAPSIAPASPGMAAGSPFDDRMLISGDFLLDAGSHSSFNHSVGASMPTMPALGMSGAGQSLHSACSSPAFGRTSATGQSFAPTNADAAAKQPQPSPAFNPDDFFS